MRGPLFQKGDVVKIDFTSCKEFLKEVSYKRMLDSDKLNNSDQRVGVILDIVSKLTIETQGMNIDKSYSYKIMIGQKIETYNEKHLKRLYHSE